MTYSDRSVGLSVGELGRKHVALHTSEATALVAEVCRHVFYSEVAQAPDLDDILLNPDGSIATQHPSPARDGDLMGQLAALLEALLPPLGAADPECSVRASLRLLAPRARQLPGLPPILEPEGLAAELDRFTIGKTADVLRGLWVRADRALHQYLPEPQSTERFQADAVRIETNATLPPVRRKRSGRLRHVLAASLMFAIGFGGGAWLGRYSYATISHALAVD